MTTPRTGSRTAEATVMTDPAEEAEFLRQARGLESWARTQPAGPADPAHVLRVHFDGTAPGVRTYWLARWSLVSRLVRDAKQAGADEVTDLGSLPLNFSHPGALVRIGTRSGGQWVSVTPGLEAIAQAVTDMEAGLSLGLPWSVMGLGPVWPWWHGRFSSSGFPQR